MDDLKTIFIPGFEIPKAKLIPVNFKVVYSIEMDFKLGIHIETILHCAIIKTIDNSSISLTPEQGGNLINLIQLLPFFIEEKDLDKDHNMGWYSLKIKSLHDKLKLYTDYHQYYFTKEEFKREILNLIGEIQKIETETKNYIRLAGGNWTITHESEIYSKD